MAAQLHYDRRRLIAPGESVTFGFDLTERLDADETLSTITTALAEDPSSTDVTLGAGAINDSTFVNDDGETVAIGKGVTCQITIAAAAADADYEILGFASTSSANRHGVFGGIMVRSS